MSTAMVEKMFAVTGWVRQDSFGRIVIDDCPSDDLHLRHSKTDPEVGKPTCRYLLEQFFDRGAMGEALIGKRGTLAVSVRFEEDPASGSLEQVVQSYCEGC